MRISLIQMASSADRAANLAAAAALIDAAVAADRPDLVALPETWNCLGGTRAQKFACAETPPAGETIDFLAAIARHHNVFVHGGSIGEAGGGEAGGGEAGGDDTGPDRLFNTSLVFAPDGTLLARYRKIHLFDVTTQEGQQYHESALFAAGDQVVTATLGELTAGLSICYDLRFPELFARLRAAGAEAIFLPAAFTAETGRAHWETLIRARAIETQSWMLAPATCGTHVAQGQTRQTHGHSMIVDPWGRVVAQLGTEPGFVTADVDPAAAVRVRRAMPVIDHHRLA